MKVLHCHQYTINKNLTVKEYLVAWGNVLNKSLNVKKNYRIMYIVKVYTYIQIKQ